MKIDSTHDTKAEKVCDKCKIAQGLGESVQRIVSYRAEIRSRERGYVLPR